jgi:hypothetical protein
MAQAIYQSVNVRRRNEAGIPRGIHDNVGNTAAIVINAANREAARGLRARK